MKTYVTRMLSALTIGAVSLAPSGCALFGSDQPCVIDGDCPDGYYCGAQDFCVEGERSLEVDAGMSADAGQSDAGVGDVAGIDGAMTDSAAADSAATDSEGVDLALPDSGQVQLDAAQDDAAQPDAARPDAAGPAGPCESPPCSLMPDSKTALCRDGNTSFAASCPADGEPLYGQDGCLSILPPSYDGSVANVVQDLVTDLTWEQIVTASFHNWDDAVAYCEDLDLGPHQDWRLPSFRELVTIQDWGVDEPTIDTTYFPTPPRGFYWSSTGYNDFYWVADFYGGVPDIKLDTQSPTGAAFNVRCVRGTPHENGTLRFTAGTWIDQKSGLQWQADHVGDLDWGEALTSCEEMELAGHGDWRVPSLKEIETIADRSTGDDPMVLPELVTASDGEYWTSTPNANDGTQDYGVWVYFTSSSRYAYRYFSGSSFRNLRCVRGH